MASLVKRGDSKVWWVSYKNENDVRKFKSTGYRSDDEKQTKLARALEAELSSKEHQRNVATDDELWANWVGDFLARHCKDRTLERYLSSWRELYVFLKEHGVNRPRDLTYQHAIAFLKWRTAQKRRIGKYIKLNTALGDMKVLRLVMRQAIRLNYAVGNPCDRLGVAKDEAKEKPEFTDDDINDIREKLATYVTDPPEKIVMMRRSFEIALNTGCRVSDTRISFKNIDFERKTITFDAPKGGKARAFTIPLPSALIPMLSEIRAAGETHTLTFPSKAGKKPMGAKTWWEFFSTHFAGKDFCFHCTRVTFVTRLARVPVPISAAMKLVNHSSTLIHKIYQRLGVEDVRQWRDAVQLPSAPVAKAEVSKPRVPGAKTKRPSK